MGKVRCSPVLALGLLFALAGSATGLAAATPAPATPPGAFDLLTAVLRAYAERETYFDRGTLEKSFAGQKTRLSFQTVRSGGRLVWELAREEPLHERHLVFFHGLASDPATGVYDPALDQVKATPSLITAMLAALGAGSLDALTIPALLLGNASAFQDPEGAAVDGPEPCGEAQCWVLWLSRMGGTSESRWWIEPTTHWIVRFEVMSLPPSPGSGGEPTWFRAEIQPLTNDPAALRTFVPPTSARRVVAWEEPPAASGGNPSASPADDELFAEGFFDEITISNAVVTARVVDDLGNARLGLGPQDLIARVRGQEIPVVAVDWVASSAAPDLPESLPLEPGAPAPTAGSLPILSPPGASGRLIVLYIQADFNAVRIKGHLRVRQVVSDDLLPTLHPDDWVAIVTFDSHLKLWQDFTRDRQALAATLEQAIRFGGSALARPNHREPSHRGPSRRGPSRRGPSLLAHFDRDRAREVAEPEAALQFLGTALQGLPGEKDVVYLGWGLGRFDFAGVRMTAGYFPALRALRDARATVFVLDVTDADSHSLEVGIERVAADTGGTYHKTNSAHLADLAVERLASVLRGHYLITLDVSAAPAGKVEIELRQQKGRVLYRPLAVRGK